MVPTKALITVQYSAAAGVLAANASSEYQVRNSRSIAIMSESEPELSTSGTATESNSRKLPAAGPRLSAGALAAVASTRPGTGKSDIVSASAKDRTDQPEPATGERHRTDQGGS